MVEPVERRMPAHHEPTSQLPRAPDVTPSATFPPVSESDPDLTSFKDNSQASPLLPSAEATKTKEISDIAHSKNLSEPTASSSGTVATNVPSGMEDELVRGDPRMKRALRIRLENTSLSPVAALILGGYSPEEASTHQHRNQLSRRVRIEKQRLAQLATDKKGESDDLDEIKVKKLGGRKRSAPPSNRKKEGSERGTKKRKSKTSDSKGTRHSKEKKTMKQSSSRSMGKKTMKKGTSDSRKISRSTKSKHRRSEKEKSKKGEAKVNSASKKKRSRSFLTSDTEKVVSAVVPNSSETENRRFINFGLLNNLSLSELRAKSKDDYDQKGASVLSLLSVKSNSMDENRNRQGNLHRTGNVHVSGKAHGSASVHGSGNVRVNEKGHDSGNMYKSENIHENANAYVNENKHVNGNERVNGNKHVNVNGHIHENGYERRNGHLSVIGHSNGNGYGTVKAPTQDFMNNLFSTLTRQCGDSEKTRDCMKHIVNSVGGGGGSHTKVCDEMTSRSKVGGGSYGPQSRIAGKNEESMSNTKNEVDINNIVVSASRPSYRVENKNNTGACPPHRPTDGTSQRSCSGIGEAKSDLVSSPMPQHTRAMENLLKSLSQHIQGGIKNSEMTNGENSASITSQAKIGGMKHSSSGTSSRTSGASAISCSTAGRTIRSHSSSYTNSALSNSSNSGNSSSNSGHSGSNSGHSSSNSGRSSSNSGRSSSNSDRSSSNSFCSNSNSFGSSGNSVHSSTYSSGLGNRNGSCRSSSIGLGSGRFSRCISDTVKIGSSSSVTRRIGGGGNGFRQSNNASLRADVLPKMNSSNQMEEEKSGSCSTATSSVNDTLMNVLSSTQSPSTGGGGSACPTTASTSGSIRFGVSGSQGRSFGEPFTCQQNNMIQFMDNNRSDSISDSILETMIGSSRCNSLAILGGAGVNSTGTAGVSCNAAEWPGGATNSIPAVERNSFSSLERARINFGNYGQVMASTGGSANSFGSKTGLPSIDRTTGLGNLSSAVGNTGFNQHSSGGNGMDHLNRTAKISGNGAPTPKEQEDFSTALSGVNSDYTHLLKHCVMNATAAISHNGNEGSGGIPGGISNVEMQQQQQMDLRSMAAFLSSARTANLASGNGGVGGGMDGSGTGGVPSGYHQEENPYHHYASHQSNSNLVDARTLMGLQQYRMSSNCGGGTGGMEQQHQRQTSGPKNADTSQPATVNDMLSMVNHLVRQQVHQSQGSFSGGGMNGGALLSDVALRKCSHGSSVAENNFGGAMNMGSISGMGGMNVARSNSGLSHGSISYMESLLNGKPDKNSIAGMGAIPGRIQNNGSMTAMGGHSASFGGMSSNALHSMGNGPLAPSSITNSLSTSSSLNPMMGMNGSIGSGGGANGGGSMLMEEALKLAMENGGGGGGIPGSAANTGGADLSLQGSSWQNQVLDARNQLNQELSNMLKYHGKN